MTLYDDLVVFFLSCFYQENGDLNEKISIRFIQWLHKLMIAYLYLPMWRIDDSNWIL